MKKTHENQQKVFNNMKVNDEMDVDENIELQLKVDEQQQKIKHLLKQYDTDDKDIV